MYYLSDTRDLGNNNDYATYMFNFIFATNNFCTIYMLLCTCVCVSIYKEHTMFIYVYSSFIIIDY